MDMIPRDWAIPEKLRARVGDEAGRQRAMVADDHLLLVLHEPPKLNDPERKGRLFWRNPQDVWDSSSLGGGEQALIRHLKEYAAIIDKLEDQVQRAEVANDYFLALKHITPLQRSVRNMTNALQEAREKLPTERELIIARDRANTLERACELLLADATNGLDFTIARQSEEMAKASTDLARAGHRLNLLAALFLPMSAIASIFGMNLKHGLEAYTSPLLFWGVLAIGIIIGLIVQGMIKEPIKAPPAKLPRK
jgi:CorA-like Mg2+ transporter protein